MNTPICDFINEYQKIDPVRFHMPGHKGMEHNGNDITEIDGADNLSAPLGIIAASEKNAGGLFGCETFYSTEGSSLCIRAMLFMVKKKAEQEGRPARILAGRNAHVTFIYACTLLDIEVEWIMPLKSESYESCTITESDIEAYQGPRADALFITSPDYLGNMLGIEKLSAIAHKKGMLVLVDNAHGAYLKFLDRSRFPIDLGADMCCSSAHKTLPVLTGGAYLQISREADSFFTENARAALSFFASTSPSYLILASLDRCNAYLGEAVKADAFTKTSELVSALKEDLKKMGFRLTGDEPFKVTFSFKGDGIGPDGREIAAILMRDNIFPEYYDREHLVLMISPFTRDEDYDRLRKTLNKIDRRGDFGSNLYDEKNVSSLEKGSENARERIPVPLRAMSMKDALMADSEYVDARDSIGRIMACPVLSCPPCVPIYMCGEIIGDEITKYCSGKISVVKNND